MPAKNQQELDMQVLLQQKIREMEKTSAEANDKTTKASKGKARHAAKAKKNEAKHVVGNPDLSPAEKVQLLWDQVQTETGEAKQLGEASVKTYAEIFEAEKQVASSRAELTRTTKLKQNLESLCRQLQTQTKALIEERRQLTETERLRRQGLADEFQSTIGDVKKKMDQQANERARLAQENEDLRGKFKLFFEQYDKREGELVEQQKARELEVQMFELRLAEQAQLYRQESTREQVAKKENDELKEAEQALRSQLQTYSNKFNHFQDALSKSNKVLGQYKRQRNKMQRRLETLEKENKEMRIRSDRKATNVTKDRDVATKEKEELQERAKLLQLERQSLKDQIAKIKSDKGIE